MNTATRVVMIGLVAGLGACGTGTGETVVADAWDAASADVGGEVGDAFAADGERGAEVNDARADGSDFASQETPEWEISNDEAGGSLGEWGDPCQTGSDCLTGLCIEMLDHFGCTSYCVDDCPAGSECKELSTFGPDSGNACVPYFVTLCKPCTESSDCRLWDGAPTYCVEYGGTGTFCAEACDKKECPDGYDCKETILADGSSESLCMKSEGECGCAAKYKGEALQSNCFVENDHGKCPGVRVCQQGALTPCDAEIPAAEKCNALDDNCDGQIDEDLSGGNCLVTNQFGSCPGTQLCLGGIEKCDGNEAAKESCDGLDNDCDGDVDEGFLDSDLDGVADCLETDSDGDGVVNGLDNCPLSFNPGQSDGDLDTIGNACDPDDDNDKSPDAEDCAPLDDAAYPGGTETCDAKDNDCNLLVDEGFADTDGDGWKDCVDPDDDNDGAADAIDCMPLEPLAHLGASEACDGLDNDCDGATDEGYADADDDGVPDCSDEDVDDDGVENASDNCPEVANYGQEDLDLDLVGDACDPDADGDSIPDAGDNCPGLKNTSQADADDDKSGDSCDADMDGDGVDNAPDNCPLVPNPQQEDTDADSVGDACEDDKDADGTPDAQDCAPLDSEIHPGALEKCDGLDNDCDFLTDEGFVDTDADLLKDCVDDDDDNDGEPDLLDCAPLKSAIFHGALETCDGVDNDCDAVIDDGLGTVSCGKGACKHVQPKCDGGELAPCDPFQGASAEQCDGLDNDCNGVTDEGLGFAACGLGACVHTVSFCKNGKPVECDPLEGAGPEACDGQDNDCDGKSDEDLPTFACGKGICFHVVSSCVGGVPQVCDPTAGAKPELCDGEDNDCDGEIDESLGSLTCGKGKCLHSVPKCVNGELVPCDPFEGAEVETCDALDNDCNGLVDESQGWTSCGVGLCLHTVPNCVDGAPNPCLPLEGSKEETCDGVDNDCDGVADEGFGETTCGLGECEHTVPNCMAGVPQDCDPLDGAGPEECDGLDNDCDGTQDNGFDDSDSDGVVDCLDDDDDNDLDPDVTDCAPYDPSVGTTIPEVCFDGSDQDCDGLSDLDSDCIFTDCLALHVDQPALGSGLYVIDPDGAVGAEPFYAYCDMVSEGGGWTMCYTEKNNMVHIKTEISYSAQYPFGTPGYRADCRNVTLNQVLYVNHDNGQRAWFSRDSQDKFTATQVGFNSSGEVLGLWTAHGVAQSNYQYQLNVCDDGWMWVGYMITGYTSCWKQCGSWCGDTSSPYFRTDGDDGGSYNGVAFNENGHHNGVSYKTMSVGVR